MRITYKLKAVAFILISSLVLTQAVVASENNTCTQALTFGVVPQQSASKLAKLWSPILNYLSERTGVKLKFKTAPNIPLFEKRLKAGEYDIAYMNPYHYTVFSKHPGYIAFAKQKGKYIRGVIVTRKDSSITSLKQLSGSTLAFPAPAAFAATLLPRAYLEQQNISVFPKYVSSHDSVYRTVEKGLYPAGGGIIRTLKNTSPAIHKQLRVLWQSAPYTAHAFAANPSVSCDIIKKLTAEMINMNQNKAGIKLLQRIKFKGVIAAHDKDWNDVRRLKITSEIASTTK